jgi:alanine dehydrogenase
MRVGVPREIKSNEHRVGLTPAGVRELKAHGHDILVQAGAGADIGLSDELYRKAGATLVKSARQVFDKAELVVKVKEPQPVECKMLGDGQLLFTYLHLAPDPQQTKGLIASGAVAIAYETVTDGRGGLPLLSIQAGAHALQKVQGGLGVLLGGVPGTAPADIVILGGGVVGYNAARIAVGMGARVAILDKSLARLKYLDELFEGRLQTVYSTTDAVEHHVSRADLVIGAVLVPGAAAPKLVTRAMLKKMKPGAVVVDVAIDQGGCFETSKPTTHEKPTYVVDGIVHYCVANMPGGVARTSTFALTNATLPYVLALADKGYRKAMLDDVNFREGLNVHHGKVTCKAVADALGYDYTPAHEALKPWWQPAEH